MAEIVNNQDLDTLKSVINQSNETVVKEVDEEMSAIHTIIEEGTEPVPTDDENNHNDSTDELTDYEKDVRDLELFTKIPFVEVITQFNQIERSKEDLKSSKEMMDQLGMQTSDPLAAKTAQGNFLDNGTTFTGKSAEEFYAQYPELVHESERISAMLKKVIELYGTEVQSTQFMSDSMAESGRRQIEALEKRDDRPLNYDFLMKRSKHIVAAYSDRTNFDPIFTKLSYPNNIVDIYKRFVDDGPEQAMKVVNAVFQGLFNDEFAKRFRTCLSNILREEDGAKSTVNDVNDFFFTYWLATNYYREETSGKFAYIKTLVMNVYDNNTGIYDLAGGLELLQWSLRSMATLINIATSFNGSVKQLCKNYGEIFDGIMKRYRDISDSLKELHPTTKQHSDTSLMAMYPDMTVESIAEDLSELRIFAESAAMADEDNSDINADEDDEEIPSIDEPMAAEDGSVVEGVFPIDNEPTEIPMNPPSRISN